MSRPSVPANTLRKNTWAVNLFNDLLKEILAHETDGHDANIRQLLLRETDILQFEITELNTILSSFFMSLRKKDGSDYTSNSIFSVATALQRYFEYNERPVSFFNDLRFTKLKNVIDKCMQEKCKQGIWIFKKQAEITIEQENHRWEKDFLGSNNPQSLFDAIFG